jgi:putative intracellular protease/amidase
MIDVLDFDGCEALDALGPCEVLAYGGLDVRAVTLSEQRMVRTAQGVELRADAPRHGAEWLIVPGGGWDARHRDPRAEAASGAVSAFAGAHHRRRGKLASVCTGEALVAMLAPVLEERKAHREEKLAEHQEGGILPVYLLGRRRPNKY